MDTAAKPLLQTCCVCKKTKKIEEYGFHKRSKKYKKQCKKCASKEAAVYRLNNIEFLSQAIKYLKEAI